jgi:cytochrome c oxidase subunit 1
VERELAIESCDVVFYWFGFYFITGGLTGIILGDSTLDINVHDTYFVVAHFHLVMGISALYGMFAGIYHWFPRMFGRMLNKIGYVHFG